jgi:TonB family protein
VKRSVYAAEMATPMSGRATVRNDALGIALISSLALHILAIMIVSIFLPKGDIYRPDLLSVRLVEMPLLDNLPTPKREVPPEVRKPHSQPLKAEKPKAQKPNAAKAPEIKAQATKPLEPAKEKPVEAIEAKPPTIVSPDSPSSLASNSRIEGGGSEAGVGHLHDRGDVGFIPGPGTAGGGGGTAATGLGRGSGAPGLPAQTGPIRTNREAKPIQTARAVYPPMALRAGLESDVTLRIEVDPGGSVTKAEIIKSGGSGFDEEALKAVKQSRFEPAQRDGQAVAAEFTYVYRFRLRR